MRIATWNVNSLNVRLPHVLDYLSANQPDVLALQETKLPDERFPTQAIEGAGYQVVYSGQKTYNGVAILSRSGASDPVTDLPGLDDHQRRLLAATVGGVRIVNVYVPNGQEVGSDKYAYKLHWLQALIAWLQDEMNRHPALVLLGDFNIAPADLDVHDPKRWREKIMCSSEEREHFQRLLALGFCDAVRALHPDAPMHSWWDYRLRAFERGWGLRIDHVLLSKGLTARETGVDVTLRAGDKPSDHVPVWVETA
jgi:exodeoxyribonuclease III